MYCCSLPSGKLFALKEILLPLSRRREFVESLEKEVALVASLDHPNLVKYYSSAFDEKENVARIFMEFVPNGSLGAMVRSMSEPMGEALAAKYVRQALAGLQYLHDHGVMHRDIKCDNLLLANDGSVKIADFGAAKLIAGDSCLTGSGEGKEFQSHMTSTMIGTPCFMAPEMLSYDAGSGGCDVEDSQSSSAASSSRQIYGKRADIWSLGIATLELLDGGRMPWPGDHMHNLGQLVLLISTDGALPTVPDRLSPAAKDFVYRCCERPPEKRWRASQLLEHEWITMHMFDGISE